MKNLVFDYTRPAVINLVNTSSEEELMMRLKSQSFFIYKLDGSAVVDKESLFEEFSSQILKDTHTNNWSGFEDYFWQLIFNEEYDHTAFVWTHVDQMLTHGLSDLIVCSDVLTSVSRQRYSQRLIHLNFFLGKGENFPPIL